MPSSTADLLDQLTAHQSTVTRPWGLMRWLDAPAQDLTVKYLVIDAGQRTSLQRHDRKDELLLICSGSGYVEVGDVRCRGDGRVIRIGPGTVHRVTGPLAYLELSSYDDDSDTVRLSDDYGRT